MGAKADIRAIVTAQVSAIRAQPGALSLDELARLELLAKVAVLADKIEAGEAEDPATDNADLERLLSQS